MSMHNQPPPQAVADLPVIETVVAAFPATYGHPLLLLRAAGGAFIILAIGFILPLAWPNALTTLLSLFAPLVAYVHFGVNWYRLQLLGPAGLVRPALRWDGRHWRSLGYSVLFLVLMVFANLFLGVTLGLVVPFAGALTNVVVLYLLARFSFVFPALAVEEPYSLAFAWRHTQGQGLRLTTALLLAGIPLYIVLSLIVAQLFVMIIGISASDIAALQAAMGSGNAPEALEEVFGSVPPESVFTVKVIVDALFMAVLAVFFTIVATAFRICTGWVPATSGNLPTAPEDEDHDGPGGPRGPGA